MGSDPQHVAYYYFGSYSAFGSGFRRSWIRIRMMHRDPDFMMLPDPDSHDAPGSGAGGSSS